MAATARYEAYPSIAYDPRRPVVGGVRRGRRALGQRFRRLRNQRAWLFIRDVPCGWSAFDTDGRTIRTSADPGSVLPGTPAVRVDSAERQAEAGEQWLDARSAERQDALTRRVPRATCTAPKNTSPRLHIDASGRIWLAVRSAHPVWWHPLGTVWSEYVVSYDGSQWTGPIFLGTHRQPAGQPAGAGLAAGRADGDRRHPTAGATLQGPAIRNSDRQ